MGRMVVTNISGGAGAENASVQLVEVPKNSPVPGQPVSMPQGNTVLNLVLSFKEAANYPVGSEWEITITKAQGAS